MEDHIGSHNFTHDCSVSNGARGIVIVSGSYSKRAARPTIKEG